MPRKTPRPPGPDDWAADRIRREREERGWSTAELARRVTEAGVPMRQQQVWQVESGEPRRRLSVGEAAAFAKVLAISLSDLMTPPEDTAAGKLVELGRSFAEWRRDAGILAARLREIDERISRLDPDAEMTATAVVKYGGFGNTFAEQAAREFGEIAKAYADIQASVMNRDSAWSVIASMRDLVTDEQTGGAPARQEQPVVVAIVTSARGVLVGRRNDGKPPWTFIAGEIEPGEQPMDAAVREVKEETGIEVTAGELIGERVHPKTGRTMIYLAATPVRGLDIFVGDEDELAEVRWVSLAEADELLPGIFEPVREYLAATIGAGSES